MLVVCAFSHNSCQEFISLFKETFFSSLIFFSIIELFSISSVSNCICIIYYILFFV